MEGKKKDVVKKGSVYETEGRKGRLILRLLEDVDISEDTFFNAEIVEGTARFISMSYKAAQAVDGLGTKGTAMPFRTSLTRLVKRREDLEVKT